MIAPGLVRCAADQDWDSWQQLWHEGPEPALTAAALSGLCVHLLRRVGELTGGDPQQILQEFALRLAADDGRDRPDGAGQLDQ